MTSDDGARRDRHLTVLVGAPGAGKSTVGALLATLTGRRFVDADEASDTFYADAGWSVDRLRARADEVGFARAHQEWEVALVRAVEGLVAAHPRAVLALGAGHSHVSTPALRLAVEAALAVAGQVVLLRPSTDDAEAVRVLRERCRTDKGHDWVVDGVDWLQRWVCDGCDERLASRVVISGDDSAERVAERIADLSRRPDR